MITLFVLNQILQWFDWLLSHLFSGFGSYLANAGSKLSVFTVPSTIYDFVSITVYFLPMGTIIVLFNITLLLIGIGLILAFLHFCVHIAGIV